MEFCKECFAPAEAKKQSNSQEGKTRSRKILRADGDSSSKLHIIGVAFDQEVSFERIECEDGGLGVQVCKGPVTPKTPQQLPEAIAESVLHF
jgi:hypothetical protein